MFENLTDRLSQTLRHVTGKAKLTEDNIKDTLREVRMALLEADVALPVVKDFVNSVKERAVGTEVSRSLTPGQAFVKIVKAELESLMGAANEDLNLSAVPPAVVLMAGLLFGAAWPVSFYKTVNGLRAAVDKPFSKPMIQTRHGIGYRIAVPDADG